MLEIIRPSIVLRPHHARMQEVQQILRGKASPTVHGRQRGKFMKNMAEPMSSEYRFDVIKSLGDEDITVYEKGIELADARLQTLTDDSYIHIDLGVDPYCFVSCKRRHCVSTNYRDGNLVDVLSTEKRHVEIIRRDLVRAGYKEGEDFIEKETTHLLYDLEGEQLNCPREGILQTVKFPSLIVRTGALRDSRITFEPAKKR